MLQRSEAQGTYYTPFLAFSTCNSPKYLEWNSASEKFKGFFPLHYAIISFGKCQKLFNFRFPEG